MNPTIVLCLSLIGFIAIDVAMRSFLLFWGLRWAKAAKFTLRGAVITTLGLYFVAVGIAAIVGSIEPRTELLALAFDLVGLGSFVLVSCLVIQFVFHLSFLRSFQAWVVTLLASVVTPLIAIFLMNPFLFEAHRISNDSMAPTLNADHYQDSCPVCGKSSYGSVPNREAHASSISNPTMKMICENFHVAEFSDVVKKVFPGDRFLLAKYLTPNRWDIVAYQPPGSPEIVILGRLIGLPGEEILLKNGAIWINGHEADYPASIKGIQYSDQHPETGNVIWGSEDRPAVLGKDEYFILGDFSEKAYDSRFFEQGATDNQPFAVPSENLRGIVTHIYWPFSRWRAFR